MMGIYKETKDVVKSIRITERLDEQIKNCPFSVTEIFMLGWNTAQYFDKEVYFCPPTAPSNENERNVQDDRVSSEYYSFKNEVLKRDNVCQCCGLDKKLEVHHINSFKNYEDLRTDVNNGVALCKYCHQKYHTIYGKGDDVNATTFGEFMKNYGVR